MNWKLKFYREHTAWFKYNLFNVEVYAHGSHKRRQIRVFQGKDKESVLKEAQAFVDSKNNQSVWKHIKDRIRFYFAMYDEI